jgi:hypothetical protein
MQPTCTFSAAHTRVNMRRRGPLAGLAWTAVKENPKLHDFYDVLSLSVDRVGQVYVSTMEAHSYPITGTQW